MVSTGLADDGGGRENHGMGILGIRSQAIGQSLRLTMPMLIPGDIPTGWRSYLGMTWTNIWANDADFLLDYEMLDTVVGVGYGFNDRWGVAAFVDNRSYFGGAMDDFIIGFHSLFGIDQDGRDTAPRGRSVIVDPDIQNQTASLAASDLGNTGVSLLLNANIEFGPPAWPSMNIYGVTRYALVPAKVFSNSDRFDYGLGMGLSKRWASRWYTHAVLGYTLYADRGATTVGNVVFSDQQLSGMFSLAWQYSPSLALMAQYLYSSAVIETIPDLDTASHEVHLGVKWRLGKAYVLDFALIENIITMDNSPDFGLHFGVSIGM